MIKNIDIKKTYRYIAVNYMFAIGCNKSVCHLVQTVGLNTEMFVPWAKRFIKDTKLPFEFLKLGHLPLSGKSESYGLVVTVAIKKHPSITRNEIFASFAKWELPLTIMRRVAHFFWSGNMR